MFSKKSFEFEKAANEPGRRQARSICALSTITLISGAPLLHSTASARPSLPLGKLAKKRFSETQKKNLAPARLLCGEPMSDEEETKASTPHPPTHRTQRKSVCTTSPGQRSPSTTS